MQGYNFKVIIWRRPQLVPMITAVKLVNKSLSNDTDSINKLTVLFEHIPLRI